VVEIATRMQDRYNLQIKALEKAQAEMYTRQQVQQMTEAQLAEFQKTTRKLQRAVNRNKTLVWVLVGYGTAATVVAAVFIGTK
jgi:anti-sigma-K factor RskA